MKTSAAAVSTEPGQSAAALLFSDANLISGSASVLWLKQLTRTGTKKSLEYLHTIRSATSILKAYSEIFPQDFASSEQPLLGVDEHGHTCSPREQEFYKLLDMRCFPIEEHVLFEESILDYIPIQPLQPYDWFEDDAEFNELPTCYQIALALGAAGEYWDELKNRFDIPDDVYPRRNLEWEMLARLCDQETSPLKNIAAGISLIDYSTGNIWLDLSYQMAWPTIDWTVENVESLTKLYKEANDLLNEFHDFGLWVEQEPVERITAILDLWNNAQEKPKPRRKKRNNANSNHTEYR